MTNTDEQERDWIAVSSRTIAGEKRKNDDEMLCLELLAGRHVTGPKGGGRVIYMTKNSPEEKCARQALAREIRRQMPGLVGELLALAVDRTTSSSIHGMKPTRRVSFEGAAPGKTSTWQRDLLILDFIRRECQKSGGKLTKAINADAHARFGVTRGNLQQIWKRYRTLLQKDRNERAAREVIITPDGPIPAQIEQALASRPKRGTITGRNMTVQPSCEFSAELVPDDRTSKPRASK